ncbi:unnamed protein product, partial [Linum tenue]
FPSLCHHQLSTSSYCNPHSSDSTSATANPSSPSPGRQAGRGDVPSPHHTRLPLRHSRRLLPRPQPQLLPSSSSRRPRRFHPLIFHYSIHQGTLSNFPFVFFFPIVADPVSCGVRVLDLR